MVWLTDLDRRTVVERNRYLKPVSSFRSTYAYQNVTYHVAGQIIPTLTGQSWDEFVKQRIFAPLEMVRSNTSIDAFGTESNVAKPYVLLKGKINVIAPCNNDNVGPAASINTSVVELEAYVRLCLNAGKFEDRQLLSEAVARDLWTPHTVMPLPTDYPRELKKHMPQYHSTYAFGWVIRDFDGQRRVFHSGGIDGMPSLVTMISEQDLGVIVFANN